MIRGEIAAAGDPPSPSELRHHSTRLLARARQVREEARKARERAEQRREASAQALASSREKRSLCEAALGRHVARVDHVTEDPLAQAKRHVPEGEQRVAAQIALLARMKAD